MHKKIFAKYGFKTLHDLEQFLAREDIKHIIGKNYDHYYDLWVARYKYIVMDEPKQKIRGSFNWLAFLGGLHSWAGYRRMYYWVFAVAFMLGVLTFFENYYDFKPVSMVAVWFMMALYSKDYYLEYLVSCAKKIDGMHSSYRVDNFLEKHNGVSVFWAFLGIVVSVIFVLGGAVLGTHLSGKELF